jgi:hypothetical protein
MPVYTKRATARNTTLPADVSREIAAASLPRTRRLSPATQEQLTNLYRLGPRVVAEAILELAERAGSPAWVAQRLSAYASMSPELVAAVGAGDFADGRVR